MIRPRFADGLARTRDLPQSVWATLGQAVLPDVVASAQGAPDLVVGAAAAVAFAEPSGRPAPIAPTASAAAKATIATTAPALELAATAPAPSPREVLGRSRAPIVHDCTV